MAFVPMPPQWVSTIGDLLTSTDATINATGESCAIVGRLYLPAQTGSKTISSAGGVIYINPSSTHVFANAGTNVRIGVQDVTAATGLEDGTFDVFDDLVGGTDTFASLGLQAVTMTSGSKTIAHGDVIAVVIEMTTRAGADQIFIDRQIGKQFSIGYPYGTADAGALGISNLLNAVLLKFDDGTLGWIDGAPLLYAYAAGRSLISFNSGSTPDEYIGAFQVAAPLVITGMGMKPEGIASADTFEMILYSDPFGTPFAERTWTPDPDGLVTNNWLRPTFAPFTLDAATWYGIALRPTSANPISWSYYDLTTGFDVVKGAQFFSAIKMAARTNQAGAFSETQVYHLPEIAIAIGGLSDDGGGGSPSPGGGSRSYGFVG